MRKTALALLLATVTACGGSTGAGGAYTSDGPGARPSAAPSGAGARAFRDVVGSASSSPYKVTYRVSSSAGGQAVSGTQTWYVSGQKFRMDLTVAQGGTTGAISIFATPDGTYSCVGSGTGPSMQCFGLPQSQAFAESPAASFDASIRQNPDAFGATFSGSRTIAGTSASCYGVNGSAAGLSQGTICYSGNGVPLLYQFDSSGLGVTMEATSFGVPSDADFALPATPNKYP